VRGFITPWPAKDSSSAVAPSCTGGRRPWWPWSIKATGSYSELLTYCTFASVFFGGLTVAAVYRLRFTQPDRPRPYRCWGYPVTPALYLAISLAFLVCVIQGDRHAPLIGLLLVLSGIPFYLVWKSRRSPPAG
jgi:APA family basic amino acid/polyamine antiporter